MNNESESAKRLIALEKELNKLKFQNVQIGSLMALFWGRIFRGRLHLISIDLVLNVIYFHLKFFFQKGKIKDFEKPFIYIKTGSHAHLKKLESAVLFNPLTQKNSLIIGPEKSDDVLVKDLYQLYSCSDILNVWIFLFKNFSHTNDLFKVYNFNLWTRIFLFFNLFIQLIKAICFLNFFTSQKNLRLVGGDYDRGADTAAFFAAASSLNLSSFTLQHGVINPPYGYHPLIADEIWVWGDMAKAQLVSLGVRGDNVRVMGTPIVKPIEINQTRKKALFTHLNLKEGKVIVLALSYADLTNDHLLVHFLNNIRSVYGGPHDNFLVKIHPSCKTEDFKWITKEFGFAIMPNPMDQSDFINLVDILLAHSSGIATEALYYGIRIGILDILPLSPGNGLELHKYFKVPMLKKVSDFEILKMSNRMEPKNKKIYDSTGEESKNKISVSIYEKIYSKLDSLSC